MSDSPYVMPVEIHDALVLSAYRSRGYQPDEAALAVKYCSMAARHGIKTHNAIKALHLDEVFGSKTGGCVPGASIEKKPGRFAAAERWNANRKLGQAVAAEAIETCIALADKYGTGTVSVDNAFHYLWGGGYVIDAADRGYIAYTNCTSTLAEVVPFGGRFPTLGTNPHSWGFPTTKQMGFPICIDWATSVIAMGRVQQFKREGKPLPDGAAVDAEGRFTTDPDRVAALVPFGAHKGYGLALMNEVVAAMIGGSLPTLRGRPNAAPSGEKTTANFFFQVIHPDAMAVDFPFGRDQAANLKAVLDDVLGHGNDGCMLPGQVEAQAAALSKKHGGLLFTAAEIREFEHLAAEAGHAFDASTMKRVEV